MVLIELSVDCGGSFHICVLDSKPLGKFFFKSFQQSMSNGSSNLVLKEVLRLLKKRELHLTKFILSLKAVNVEAEA